MSAFKCVVPGCGARLSAEMAFVPELSVIRKVAGKAITVAELVHHAFCPRHNRMAREQKVRTFRYLDTVKVIEKRDTDRGKDAQFLSTMYVAFRKVEAGSPSADKP